MARSRRAATSARTPTAAPVAGIRISAGRAFLLNAGFVGGLLALSQLSVLQERPVVRSSIVAAALLLLAWSVLLFGVLRRRQEWSLEIVLRRQHYLQACQQGAVILYWGYYWREVYHAAPLIAAQLLFAYGFDSLLSWTHRRRFLLGFGPFPVIFSITLFLWFKDNWFYLQFAMVALGFLAKEFLRWTRDDLKTHIFNPSSFPLAVVSALLLLTNASGTTWGYEVATTQFYPPQMYLAIFLFGLPGQYLFGVTTMTMSAVVTTFVFSAIYYTATGVYFFSDSHVPIAVFLGMHLLFTDPATSPRTELGRIIYGVLYGLTTVLAYDWLLRSGMPGFYDKLLPVPLLNLSAKLIDRAARSPLLQRIDPSAWGRALLPRRRHLAYMTVWAVAFGAMSATGYLGDKHPGQWLPFWQRACAGDLRNACEDLYFQEDGFCEDGSGWACNELGILLAGRYANPRRASMSFDRACALGFSAGCDNASAMTQGGMFRREAPTLADYQFILRGSKGPFPDRDPAQLYARACIQGWPGACGTR
jgi:NQR2/RnfD/RnfE family subunit of NADH-ubiquinone oxidoreductase